MSSKALHVDEVVAAEDVVELLSELEGEAEADAADGAAEGAAEESTDEEVDETADDGAATDEEDGDGPLELEDVDKEEQPPGPPHWLYRYSSKQKVSQAVAVAPIGLYE